MKCVEFLDDLSTGWLVMKVSTPWCYFVQGDEKVSVHLMITIQKVTSIVQSVSRQSPDIY
jgi:hypothetical protein